MGKPFLGLAIVAVFFAVNAAAIGLSIHAQPSGFVNTGFPPVSKILVIEGYAYRFSHGLANGSDLVMLLEAAVEKGGGKPVEFAFFCEIGRGGQPVMIAVGAALGFPESHIPQKGLQIIAGVGKSSSGRWIPRRFSGSPPDACIP
jgi:hypothetical protein